MFQKLWHFIASSDYLKFRVGGLILVVIIFMVTGQLLTKTSLLVILIILGYILVTYLAKVED